ncbi:hypothetical protein [Streptomyces sp. NPDC005408]|uniref:hypothetical protein n=1 Tax=Streptomyces sp. NPDC005408 TaxID=3155341 RepID=UPI0033A4B2B4
MHGHGFGPAQPDRPTTGTLVTLRMVFAVLTVLSCGLLAWIPMLRLAIVTRRALHWGLFCAVLVLNIGFVVYVGVAVPDDENQELSDATAITMLLWILGTVVGALTYYLYAEIRHYEQLAAPSMTPPSGPVAGYGYGYPPPVQAHQQPTPVPQPQPQPQPARPRIDQVRAELDELSNLLRKEEGK